MSGLRKNFARKFSQASLRLYVKQHQLWAATCQRGINLGSNSVLNITAQYHYRFICLVLMLICLTPAAFADRTIVIIRHAEKPRQGLGQLSCRGLNRSLAITPLLLKRYGQPLVIYAPNPAIKKTDYGVAYAYIRPLATIEPLAIAVGMPVTLDFGMTDIEHLAQMILSKQNGTQIIAWEHHWGEALARELLSRLGQNPAAVPVWNDEDFDGIFVIRTGNDKNGNEQIAFSRETENLSNISDQCPSQPLAAPHDK